MTLVFSTKESLYKTLNRSLTKIGKNLWLGQLTMREIERIEALSCPKTMIFKVAKENNEKYLQKGVDVLFEV